MQPLDTNTSGTCQRLNEDGEFVSCDPMSVGDTGEFPTDTESEVHIPDPEDVPQQVFELDSRQLYPEPSTVVSGSVQFGLDEASGLLVSEVNVSTAAHSVVDVTLQRGWLGGPSAELVRFFEEDEGSPGAWKIVDEGLLTEDELRAWNRGEFFVSVATAHQVVLRAQVVPKDVSVLVTDINADAVSAYHESPQTGTARAFLVVNETTGDASFCVHASGIEPSAVQVRQGSIGDAWGDGPEIHVTYQPQGTSNLWASPNYTVTDEWLFAMRHGHAYFVLYTDQYPSLEGVGALRGLIDLEQ